MEAIDDCDHPGQILVRLKYLDGHVTDIALTDLNQDQNAMAVNPSGSSSFLLGPLHRSINEQLAKAKAELASIRLKNAQTFYKLSETLRFGRPGIRGDVRQLVYI